MASFLNRTCLKFICPLGRPLECGDRWPENLLKHVYEDLGDNLIHIGMRLMDLKSLTFVALSFFELGK